VSFTGVTVGYGYFLATLKNDLQQQPKSSKEARAVIDEAVVSGLIKWDLDEAQTLGKKAVKKRRNTNTTTSNQQRLHWPSSEYRRTVVKFHSHSGSEDRKLGQEVWVGRKWDR
jgi:hypothetical protein